MSGLTVYDVCGRVNLNDEVNISQYMKVKNTKIPDFIIDQIIFGRRSGLNQKTEDIYPDPGYPLFLKIISQLQFKRVRV